MDDKLTAVLHKVIQLSKQNPEFNAELRKELGITPSASVTSVNEQRISHIEEYLGLDYSIDSQPSLIDYSYVLEDEIREQLISDNREMMRFRYGTRYHEICFDEFCRFAMLQAEMLFNYYYNKKNNTFEKVKQHIKQYNTDANVANAKNLSAIQFAVKLWAFRNELLSDDRDFYTTWDYIRKVRNTISHRSPENEISLELKNYRERLESMGFPVNEQGTIIFYKLKKDAERFNLFNNTVKSTEEYKSYLFSLWLISKPFDNIIAQLKKLSTTVRDNL